MFVQWVRLILQTVKEVYIAAKMEELHGKEYCLKMTVQAV